MKVRDIMKTNPEVITQDCTLQETAQKMKTINTGVLPVVGGTKDSKNKDQVIGVITDRDIVIRSIAEGKEPDRITVKDTFSKDTIFASEDDSVTDAFNKMLQNNVGRLLVKNKNQALAGIISMADILEDATEEVCNFLQKSNQTMRKTQPEKELI
jgi:CBS domain-containing protein